MAEERSLVPSKREAGSANIEQATGNDQKHARGLRYDQSPSPESDSGPDLSETFENSLTLSMKKSLFEKTPIEFLPRQAFEDCLTDLAKDRRYKRSAVDVVIELMGQEPEKANEEDRALARYVLDSAKTVFLITFWIKADPLHAAIALFRESGFNDSSLPLEEWSSEQLDNDLDNHRFRRMERSRRKTKRRIWTVWSIHRFQQCQWQFQAAMISTRRTNHSFGQRTIPFISKGTKQGGGAHGIVYRYEIHPAHFEDPLCPGKTPNCVVAVKAFRQSGEKVTLDWKREVDALAKMNELEQEHIVRFITAFQRGNPGDLEHYVVFEWADGGNLRDLWDTDPRPELTASRMKWWIEQLHGLAQALTAAHYMANGASYRHGDLKPANILWFPGAHEYGILKIGDWGEAKSHKVVTALRHNTTAKFGTRRYEPPETGLQSALPKEAKHVRSRLYDIWGIGCITFEIIIWLLYGIDGLNAFNQADYGHCGYFYEVNDTGDAKIHHVVTYWMEHMEKDPLCRPTKTAVGDLLQVVRTGLLVVKLPEGGGMDPQADADQLFNAENDGPEIKIIQAESMGSDVVVETEPGLEARFRATQLKARLHEIRKSETESYWYQDFGPKPAPVGSEKSPYLSAPPTSRTSKPNSVSLRVPESDRNDYGQISLDPEDWTYIPDNDFAAHLLSGLNDAKIVRPHQRPEPARLCAQCQNFGELLQDETYRVSYDTQILQQSALAKRCELCCLLWQTCEHSLDHARTTVQFRRQNSMFMMSGAKRPVLTLTQSYSSESQTHGIQIGFAELPEAGSDLHVALMRGWLDDCDRNHSEPVCKPSKDVAITGSASKRWPTRLIDVGNAGDDIVKLRAMRTEDTGDWIALSYRWGLLPHFSTTLQNLESHITGMSLVMLPRTFRHAIKVTRALGHRYLWIDSICIIQGEDGDFSDEFKRMEDVYSGAYCVLAASCATGQRSGFLLPRAGRSTVALSPKFDGGSTTYVCSMIDKFRDHVLQGALNKRGWVLQEHALARRTIFFTEYQTYWECGHGVRCETMTRMTNQSAALLGDPNFPKILNPAKRGERILRFQELYQQYSRLELSSDYDRPTAIDGLQQRLLRTMAVYGGFGILDDHRSKGLLRRSLLWRRGEDTTRLKPIKFPVDREHVPSWSWMAFSGGIDYFPLTWNGYDWQDIKSPWPCPTSASPSNTFTGKVREFDCSVVKDSIVFDDATMAPPYEAMAFVLGIEKEPKAIADKKHYILVVRPRTTPGPDGDISYERIGAGYVLGSCLKGESKTCSLV